MDQSPAARTWQGLSRLGACSALFVLVMIPVQAVVFLLNPPPVTTQGFFQLFQENPFLGMLSLDLLLTLDYLAMIPFYLSLYGALRRLSPAWGLLALVTGLFSLVLFVVSREATLSMWSLSDQYAAASTDTERSALLAAGTGLLSLYNGGTFAISYLLGAVSTLVFSTALLRHRVFGRWPGAVGIVTGVTMLVPANAGTAGLVLAMVSLLPTALWLILLIPGLWRGTAAVPADQPGPVR